MQTFLNCVLIPSAAIFGVLAGQQWDPPDDGQPHNKFHWKPEDGVSSV